MEIDIERLELMKIALNKRVHYGNPERRAIVNALEAIDFIGAALTKDVTWDAGHAGVLFMKLVQRFRDDARGDALNEVITAVNGIKKS